MPRRATPLSAARVMKAPKGRFYDGDGLQLLVQDRERAWWVFRYSSPSGKLREIGLGRARGPRSVTLADARNETTRLRNIVRRGVDPLDERKAEATRKLAKGAAKAAAAMTFRDVARQYVQAHEAGWRNEKHRQQWTNTLREYALPVIGDSPVADVGTAEVMLILQPIWHRAPETASRLRGRIEAILDYARTREWRSGENPARWKGHLANLLPARGKIRRISHHAALPWREIGSFIDALRQQAGISAKALEFAILTAARSGEVRGASWAEIDWATKTWTVPGSRMKGGREHRVPLSEPAMAVLRTMEPLRASQDALIFPGRSAGHPLSDMSLTAVLRRMGRADLTQHGFRSSLRDWAAETTHYPREVAEQALAHALPDKVEAAYRRGDLFEKRCKLMNDWAAFCSRPALPASGSVVELRAVT
jgi:integrase